MVDLIFYCKGNVINIQANFKQHGTKRLTTPRKISGKLSLLTPPPPPPQPKTTRNGPVHNLRTATEELEEDKEPTLDDYYEPSDEMKRYMDIVAGVIGSVSGFLFSWLWFK